MALVPGLRADPQERPDVSRNTSRVGIESDGVGRPQRLRPTAAPIETYTRPPAIPKDDSAERLISALAPLNRSLLTLGSVLHEEKKKDGNADLNAWISTKKADEVRQEIRDNPNGPMAVAIREEKGQELFAAKVAQDVVLKAQEEWAGGQKDGVDIEQFIASKLDPVLKEYGGNKRFINEFIRLSKPGLDTLRNGQLKHNVEVRERQEMQGVSALLERTIENGIAEKRSPDDIAAAVRAEIKGNKDLARLDPAKQESELLNVLQRRAVAGDVPMVRAIATSKGANGISLQDSREHGLKVTQLLEAAEKQRRENNRNASYELHSRLDKQSREGSLDEVEVDRLVKERPGTITEAMALTLKARNAHEIEKRTLQQQKLHFEAARRDAADESQTRNKSTRIAAFRDGKLWSMPSMTQFKENGETEEIDPEKGKKQAVKDFLEDSERYAVANKEDPKARYERELPMFRQNGVEHPEWASTMKAGINTISAVTTSGDKLPEAFTEGYRLYSDLKTRAPGVLNASLGKEDREKWEVMDVMIGQGLDPSKAAAQYNLFSKEPTKLRELYGEGTRQEIDDVIKRKFSDATNQGHVRYAIMNRAITFAGAGLGTKAALEKATEEYKRSHTKINGWYIDLSDRQVPPDFADLATSFINDYVAAHGKKEMIDVRDIAIVSASAGTGAWNLVDARTGALLDNPADRVFTLGTLAAIRAAREEAARKSVIDAQESKAKARETRTSQENAWRDRQRMIRELRTDPGIDPVRDN